MEYKPRYTQPFTLAEAISLDVSIITEEITRLQNSLKHLRDTQQLLRDYVVSEAPADPDPEVNKAIEENEVVIGSQDERISMLKMALAEKGVLGGSHYDLVPDTQDSTPAIAQPRLPEQSSTNGISAESMDLGEDGDGIHL